ncbi:hypothetical protein [Polaromonas sp.]|uniref:hypothetical protein n=1 Tax=Polaromonas sp. TaxID=1869339 RepID=UPI003262CD4A
MTDKADVPRDAPVDGRIAIKLQRDKDGQFLNLPKGWKFTNNKVTAHKTEAALVLMSVRPGKLKRPQMSRQASDYPKTTAK